MSVTLIEIGKLQRRVRIAREKIQQGIESAKLEYDSACKDLESAEEELREELESKPVAQQSESANRFAHIIAEPDPVEPSCPDNGFEEVLIHVRAKAMIRRRKLLAELAKTKLSQLGVFPVPPGKLAC